MNRRFNVTGLCVADKHYMVNLAGRMAVMFGFAVVQDGFLRVANRIFETRLYNGFLSEESRNSEISQLALAESYCSLRDQ